MTLPITHIRSSVFRLSQAEFAQLAGATQGTVSRWEQGKFTPKATYLARIRAAALQRGLEWDDSWFFDQPSAQ